MVIYVKHVGVDKTSRLNVEDTDTIDTVKAYIQGKEGIPRRQQRLLHGPDELQDDRALWFYNIDDGATLDLVLGLFVFVLFLGSFSEAILEPILARFAANFCEIRRRRIWNSPVTNLDPPAG